MNTNNNNHNSQPQQPTQSQQLADLVIKLGALGEGPEYEKERKDLSYKCNNRIKSFTGAVKKNFEHIGEVMALACTSSMAFKDNNPLGQLFYEMKDPENGMANASLAKAVQEVALYHFGVKVGLQKSDGVEKAPYYNKNCETDTEKGTVAPQDMNRDHMLQAIRILQNDAGGFRELVLIARANKKEKAPKEPSVTLTQIKANPAANTALTLALNIMEMQKLTNAENLDIKKVVADLNIIVAESNNLMSGMLAAKQAESLLNQDTPAIDKAA